MGSTAADVLIETIQDWGVDVVFGLPGDGINGIMEARVWPTLEVIIVESPQHLRRRFDAETGLALIDPGWLKNER